MVAVVASNIQESGAATRNLLCNNRSLKKNAGHIYDCSDSYQADQYVKTTKEITEHVGRSYKYCGDARLAVENLCAPVIPVPNDLAAGETMTERCIWEKQVDKCVKHGEAYGGEHQDHYLLSGLETVHGCNARLDQVSAKLRIDGPEQAKLGASTSDQGYHV